MLYWQKKSIFTLRNLLKKKFRKKENGNARPWSFGSCVKIVRFVSISFLTSLSCIDILVHLTANEAPLVKYEVEHMHFGVYVHESIMTVWFQWLGSVMTALDWSVIRAMIDESWPSQSSGIYRKKSQNACLQVHTLLFVAGCTFFFFFFSGTSCLEQTLLNKLFA